MKKATTILLSEKQHTLLEKERERIGLTKTSIIRLAIDRYFKQYNNEHEYELE